MAQDPITNNKSISEQDEYEYKYTQPSHVTKITEEEEKDPTLNHQFFSDIINDNDDIDPSISDIDTPKNGHNRTPSHRERGKSKSSSDILTQLQFNDLQSNYPRSHSPINGKKKSKSNKTSKEIYIRQRRHSESSSESHSNEYRKKHHHHHHHKSSKSSQNKYPMLIPLNVNGKSKKQSPHPSPSTQKKSNSNPQSPRDRGGRKSFTRSILNKYKSVKLQSKRKDKGDNDEENKSLGISGPLNVQHVIHVEWDDQRKAYKVWYRY